MLDHQPTPTVQSVTQLGCDCGLMTVAGVASFAHYCRKLTTSSSAKEAHMHARVATFESDAAKVDDAIEMVRGEVESGETPAGLEGAKMLMLVNRESGKGLGITLFESEDAMRRGDEALNAMNPGASERRTSVEFYEVPVQTVS
jgi:hypothetical protein